MASRYSVEEELITDKAGEGGRLLEVGRTFLVLKKNIFDDKNNNDKNQKENKK
jgi:hypothetical protein